MATQAASLLFRETPTIDFQSIANRAQEIAGSNIETSLATKEAKRFHHTDYQVRINAQQAVAETATILMMFQGTVDQDTIQQSHACEDVEQRVKECKKQCIVMETMPWPLPALDRLLLFHSVLRSMVEHTKPHAISFGHSQQITTGTAYLDSCGMMPINRVGTLNVRCFRVENSTAKEIIMDTRGMQEIGLNDFQCHFTDRNPKVVSQALLNAAVYLLENDEAESDDFSMFKSLSTPKWVCSFEDALVGPRRPVVNVNLGPKYSPGHSRERSIYVQPEKY